MNRSTDTSHPDGIQLYCLGQADVVWQAGGVQQHLRVQPKPLHLLIYLALQRERAHRREELRAIFWPEKTPSQAASDLRQALWHLRRKVPTPALVLQNDAVRWNPATGLWSDAQAFEERLDAGDLDAALLLYAGPLLPDCYDEWAQLERERLHLRYLTALETRAQRYYEARRWAAALDDTRILLAADPLNEAATRLLMAGHWAVGQREAARRHYEAFRQRLQQELDCDPLPETTALHQRILRGEPHPDHEPSPADEEIAARQARFSLLETLGAFRQGLEQATEWVAKASGSAQAEAQRWRGRFCLRRGQLAEAYTALLAALPLATEPSLRAAVLADLAGVEVALGDYAAAEAHYLQVLPDQSPERRARILSSLGGLQARLGHYAEARAMLEEAVSLGRAQEDPAILAVVSGNLGILLIGQGELAAAQSVLQEALLAARRADAHWLTAHFTGHLGVLAQDQGDREAAAQYYQEACTLARAIGDQRSVALWTLNLGAVRCEQGRFAEAMPLLTAGREAAAAQGSRSLESGALIFIGTCLVGQGQHGAGLASIAQGLALAQEVADQERILIGLLHRGRALATAGQVEEARATLEEGLHRAEASHSYRLGKTLRAELDGLSPSS